MDNVDHNAGPYTLDTYVNDAARARYGKENSPDRRFESFVQFLKDKTNAVRQPAPGSAGIGNGAEIFDFNSIERAYVSLFWNADLGVGPSLEQEAKRFREELERMKNTTTGTVSDSQIGTALKAHIPKKS